MNVADYSVTELSLAFAAALRAVDAFKGLDLDVVIRWQEEAEGRLDAIAMELQGRIAENDEEERERVRAIAAYAVRLMELPE